jgi:peptidoglycan/LPS O-acetylase OafA/YrhL
LWSLSVEEHFYLVFPLLFLVFRRNPRRLAAVLGGLIAAALVWRAILVIHFEVPAPRTYMGSDTRFDSPLTGALLACVCALREKKLLANDTSGLKIFSAGMALIGITFFIREEALRETVRYSLQNLGIALSLYAILFSRNFHAVRLLLAGGPLHVCGIISYSLYLWHVIILHLVSRGLAGVMPDPGIAAIAAMLSFIVAFLSWLILEKRTAGLRKRFGSRASATSYDREETVSQAPSLLTPLASFRSRLVVPMSK